MRLEALDARELGLSLTAEQRQWLLEHNRQEGEPKPKPPKPTVTESLEWVSCNAASLNNKVERGELDKEQRYQVVIDMVIKSYRNH